MGEDRLNYLLKKYNASYVKGEKRLSETNKQLKRKQRRLEKHNLCEELLLEINLHFAPYQKDFIHYLIDVFADEFKKLHGRASNEVIILVFMFYTKKIEDPRLNLNNYSISRKYGLTDSIFKLIVCRICDYYIKNSSLVYQETTRYDHEILSKNGGRI